MIFPFLLALELYTRVTEDLLLFLLTFREFRSRVNTAVVALLQHRNRYKNA